MRAAKMRHIHFIPMVSCLALLGLTVMSAEAQRPAQNIYRTTDANPMIGTGGLNSNGYQQPINVTNLTVSGNVTAGRSFQGFSPIRNPSTFGIDLPSGNLADFRRDSLSYYQATSRGETLYRPEPYFDPFLTITNAGAVARGLNVPGTSIPRDIYSNPYVNYALPQDQTFPPPSLDIGDTRLNTGSFAEQPIPDFRNQVFNRPITPSAGETNPWIAQSDLFNSNLYIRREQESSVDVLSDLRARPTDQPAVEEAEDVGDVLDTRIDMRIDTRLAEEPIDYSAPELAAPPEQVPYVDYTLPGQAALRYVQAGWPVPSITPTAAGQGAKRTQLPGVSTESATPSEQSSIANGLEASAGSDDYAAKYQEQAEQQRRAALTESAVPDLLGAREALGGTAPTGTPKPLPGEYSLPVSRRTKPASDSVPQQLAGLRADNVTTFVGTTDTRLNRQLGAAEDLMRAGQYFRAAGQYEIARVMAPSSPLPVVGRAQALIAAGDYYAAVRYLISGIQAWPDFGTYHIDLRAFIPDETLLDRRRADLEQRLAERDRYEFRFLLGYIEVYMGLPEFGWTNLEKAAATAPSGSFIATFPELIRDQKPAEQAEPEIES
jgi:hypothetical protein